MKLLRMILVMYVLKSVSGLDFGNLNSMLLEHLVPIGAQAFSKCKTDLVRMVTDSKSRGIKQMLDSFGRPGSGILFGNFYMSGAQMECNKVSVPGTRNSFMAFKPFKGKFCYLLWSLAQFKQTIGLATGACLPESCKEKEVLKLYPFIMDIIELRYPGIKEFPNTLTLKKVDCSEESEPLSNLAKASIFVVSVCVFLVAFATFLDYIRSRQLFKKSDDFSLQPASFRNLSFLDKYLICFSGLKNTRSVLSLRRRPGEMCFVHGIKVLCIIWLAAAHVHAQAPMAERNAAGRFAYHRTALYQTMLQSVYAVDSMFFISAFLMTFISLKSMKKHVMNLKAIVVALIFRYIRLVPTTLLMIILATNVIAVFDNDTRKVTRITLTYTCDKVWWTYPLLISNLFYDSGGCNAWVWYVSADFQLFVVGVIVVAIIQRSQVWGSRLAVVLMLTTSCIGAAVANKYHITNTLNMMERVANNTAEPNLFHDAFTRFIMRPYARGEGYWVGVLFAVFAYTRMERKRSQHSAKSRYSLLIGSVSILLYIFYYPYYGPTADFYVKSMIFSGRSLWSLGLALLFYYCMTSPKSLVCRALSWRGWTPLSKLSFCLYLFHIVLLNHTYWNSEQPITFTMPKQHTYSAGLVLSCYVCSFFLYLVFEAPFINMAKLLVQKKID